MNFPKDVNGKVVKIGDKVKGEGYLNCNHGFRIDLTPIVTANEKNGILFFGQLSAKSFRRFWIVG
jgi:hypothetical protein